MTSRGHAETKRFRVSNITAARGDLKNLLHLGEKVVIIAAFNFFCYENLA